MKTFFENNENARQVIILVQNKGIVLNKDYHIQPWIVTIFTKVPHAIVHNESLRDGRGKDF